MRVKIWLIIFALLLLGLSGANQAFGQEDVTFAPTEVSIDFPDSITFHSNAVSSGSDIVKAQFVYYLDRYGALDNTTRSQLDIQPGKNVPLTYEWDTSDITVVPWAPIVYQWRVTDADGNVYETDPQRVDYEDNRFDWQERADADVIIRWHDKPANFGEDVFEIAQKAIGKQKELFGIELAIPIQIIVYNNQDEFNDWHDVALTWVGGEAFPDFGITTQIVSSNTPDPRWLNDVIPHEISHLYLYQAAFNPVSPVPTWLDEGVAQFNELGEDDTSYLVKDAVKEGKLIPLTTLESGFGKHDEVRIRLAYAEGLSAVRYLVQTYGEEGLARLLADYKKGMNTEKAFLDALGVSMGQFQQDWAESVGAPRESMNTPTPWPIATYPPVPTPGLPPGKGKTPTPSPTPPVNPAASGGITPSPSPSPEASSTPTPTVVQDENASPRPPICSGLIILLPLPLAAVTLHKRRRK